MLDVLLKHPLLVLLLLFIIQLGLGTYLLVETTRNIRRLEKQIGGNPLRKP